MSGDFHCNETLGSRAETLRDHHLIMLPYWKPFCVPSSISFQLVAVFVTIVGILGVLGNLLIIYIYLSTKAMRNAQGYLVINMAVSDAAFSLFNGFPLTTIAALKQKWIWEKSGCDLFGYSSGVFGLNSLTTIALIAIEQYLTVSRFRNVGGARVSPLLVYSIIFSWLWSNLWTIPPLFGISRYVLEGYQIHCSFDYVSRDLKTLVFNILFCTCGFFLPLITICYGYTRLFCFVRKHEFYRSASVRTGEPLKGKRRLDIRCAKVTLLIAVLFLISWGPYALVCLVAIAGFHECLTPTMTQLPALFVKLSAVHNPLVQVILSPRVRQKVTKLLKRSQMDTMHNNVYNTSSAKYVLTKDKRVLTGHTKSGES